MSHGTKSKNNHKLSYLKILLIFIKNHIENPIDHAKIYMTLLIYKNIQSNYLSYQLHLLDFCLLRYLLSSDSKAMTLHTLHTSVITPLNQYLKLFKSLNKNNLN